jgi:hypothetical protein
MTVYAIYIPSKGAYVGTNFFVSSTPHLYWRKGAAVKKAETFRNIFGLKCNVVELSLIPQNTLDVLAPA